MYSADFHRWYSEKLKAFPEYKGFNEAQLYEMFKKELDREKKKLEKDALLDHKFVKEPSILKNWNNTYKGYSKSLLLSFFPIKVVDLYNISSSYYDEIVSEINQSLEILKKIRKRELKNRIIEEILESHSAGLKMKIIGFINEDSSNAFNNSHFKDKDLKEVMDSSVRDCSDILIDLIIENNPEIRDLDGNGADKAELKIKKSVKWSE